MIPDDLFVLETVVLSQGEVSSFVFAKLLEIIAEIRNISTEELGTSYQYNFLKLIKNDPKLKENLSY